LRIVRGHQDEKDQTYSPSELNMKYSLSSVHDDLDHFDIIKLVQFRNFLLK